MLEEDIFGIFGSDIQWNTQTIWAEQVLRKLEIFVWNEIELGVSNVIIFSLTSVARL